MHSRGDEKARFIVMIFSHSFLFPWEICMDIESLSVE